MSGNNTKITREKLELNLPPLQVEENQVTQKEFSRSPQAERGRMKYEARELTPREKVLFALNYNLLRKVL